MNEKRFLIADIGSTTTKALLFEISDEKVVLLGGADAPTTVEAPHNDVKLGLFQAVSRLEKQLHLPLTDEKHFLQTNTHAIEGLLATSSAGGGLQMLVVGLVKTMTAESAERAALGAGAVLLDVMAQDDGLEMYERVARIRELRPDMILLAGGIEGGALLEVAVMIDILTKADPKSRLGNEKVPLIYAGNSDVRSYFDSVQHPFDVRFVSNLRPAMDREDLNPARLAIQEVFLHHVMTQAPGYAEVSKRVTAPILPTPLAVGKALQLLAKEYEHNVMAMDIGGATTDVFSVFKGTFYRTVSANLGMSYSAMHVLAEAGIENILRWLPEQLSEEDVRDWLHNKMLRPTTLPVTPEALLVEQALAREALRLSLTQHFSLTVALRGNKREGDATKSSEDFFGTETLFGMKEIDWLIGSGGVVSHAPNPMQAAMMMIDGFLPQGYTKLSLDRSFMLPHAGAFSQVDEKNALRILDDLCLMPLGGVLSPVAGYGTPGEKMGKVTLTPKHGASISKEVRFNEILVLPLATGEEAELQMSGHWKLNYGNGFWKPFNKTVQGGEVGILIDLRGRDLRWEKALKSKRQQSQAWQAQWMQGGVQK
jgi:uncharacterized protein (TIGR01319 family)